MNKTILEVLETALNIQGNILETIDLSLDETVDIENSISDIVYGIYASTVKL